ncbi:MAG TPA: hypothetical protein VMW50_04810 [Dehalococcoidia bacterium]|nr:hypothetical protein [Dehalococcoidia bacterium]
MKEIQLLNIAPKAYDFYKETAQSIAVKATKQYIAKNKLFKGTPTTVSFKALSDGPNGFQLELVMNNRGKTVESVLFKSYITRAQIEIEYMKGLFEAQRNILTHTHDYR